jgi:ATP-dependent NAD(P)H-hydrate dehydratase
MSWSNLEQVISAIRAFIPPLTSTKHKGQAGKIAVLGGCREYTGAPFFSAISSLKVGADLSHVFCTKGAGTVIKSYSPELIVHPVLEESYDHESSSHQEKERVAEKAFAEMKVWLPVFDCMVIGPGLGRDELLLRTVSKVIQEARKAELPLVLDGDGLWLVTQHPELVHGYKLAILTPNPNEHKRLVDKVFGEDYKNQQQDVTQQLKDLAKRLGNVTILQKGSADRVSDGETARSFGEFGSPRRVGGQGDIMTGSVAVFMAWARQFVQENEQSSDASKLFTETFSSNPNIAAGIAGSLVTRYAAMEAFAKHKRSTTTTEIIAELGASIEALFPVGPSTQGK